LSIKPEAVLFDFDGVLVDSEPVHFVCWNEILRPFGLELGWDHYVSHCVGISDKEMVTELCRLLGRPEAFQEIWNCYPKKKQILRERIIADFPMPKATRSLLADLRPAGVKVAVVSSSGRTEVETPLREAGLWEYFDLGVCAEDVVRKKPDPEPYRLAAERLGVAQALVVEDSDAGCASGTAAGFEVLRVMSAEEMAGRVRSRLGL
jgi:beta-phosphoglucomutase